MPSSHIVIVKLKNKGMNSRRIYKPRHLLLLLLSICTFLQAGHAEKAFLLPELQERLLTDILDDFSEKYQVFFSYDSKSVRDVKVEFEFKSEESFEKAINRLLNNIGFRYESYGEKFIIIYKENEGGKQE